MNTSIMRWRNVSSTAPMTGRISPILIPSAIIRVSTTDSSRRRGQWVVPRGTWCGETASVACSVTPIARPLDATQYFNHTPSFQGGDSRGRGQTQAPGTEPRGDNGHHERVVLRLDQRLEGHHDVIERRGH